MTLKVIGGIIIIISCVILGLYNSRIFTDRVNELRNQYSFYIKLKDKLTSGQSDLPNSMEMCMENIDFHLKIIILKFIDNIRSKNYTNYFDAFKSVEFKDSLLIKREDINALTRMLQCMDSSGLAGFIQAVDEHLQYVKQTLDKCAENENKNKKLYFNIWLYVGILIVVLLI